MTMSKMRRLVCLVFAAQSLDTSGRPQHTRYVTLDVVVLVSVCQLVTN